MRTITNKCIRISNDYNEAKKDLEFLYHLEIENINGLFVPAFSNYYLYWKMHRFFIEKPNCLIKVYKLLMEKEKKED